MKDFALMHSVSKVRFQLMVLCLAVGGVGIAGCHKKADDADTAAPAGASADASPAAGAGASGAGASPAAAPAADNTDTIAGVKFASFTGDAAKGKEDFTTCMTCHAIEAGVNKIGPSLHGVVGRKSGSIPDFSYSAANKNSGITWTEAKLFQYLENPQRVVPGTKMSFPGWSDPQKRADVIAYLKSNS